ncbi:hypothetical protein HY375_01355 [Candidatus Berkelbacteria bacterium]|nr:hypothetical protein [Candidatus Berkelbacteria bacterium]
MAKRRTERQPASAVDELSGADASAEWIAWEAPAYRPAQRGWWWYVILAVVAAVAVAYFYVYDDRNYSAMAVVLAALVLLIQQSRETPPTLRYELGARGFQVGDRRYGWDELKSFWLSEAQSGAHHLYLETTSRWNPVQTIHLANVEPGDLRTRLSQHLPEHPTRGELFTDTLIRWFKL